MIEVNFFEKKAKNVLPHLMGLIFFVGLILIGVYFSMMHGLYVRQHLSNEQLIEQRFEDVTFSRELERVDRLTAENLRVLSTLEEQQYPMVFLMDDITQMIPDEAEVVELFEVSDDNMLVLHIDGNALSGSADLIRDFQAVDYISRVHLERLEQDQQQADEYLFELTLDIDEDQLRGGLLSDDEMD